MSKVIEVNVPDIGGHNDVDVIEVAVKVGDTVALEDTLITLETDKATMDVPSTVAGVITAIKVNVGSKVSEGDCIVLVEAAASAATTPVVAAAAPASPAPAAAPVASPAARSTICVPDIGGHNDVDVIEVAVKVGDVIALDDTLITLETDKATMDVPCHRGRYVMTAVAVKVGDKVSEGGVIVEVAASGGAVSPAAAAPAPAPATCPAAGRVHRPCCSASGGRCRPCGRAPLARSTKLALPKPTPALLRGV
jgi:pyruvate dehydrogenase E2 component (dihydrolipoamide acetyltransferase)